MRIAVGSDSPMDFSEVAEDAANMVRSAIDEKRDKHLLQTKQLVEAVFVSSMEAAVKHEIKMFVAEEVRKFFASKDGRRAVQDLSKQACQRAIDALLETDK